MNTVESPSSSASAPATTKLQLPSIVDPPSAANPPSEKIWIIFGATGHMGRSLVRAALSHGDKITAVGQSQQNSMKQMRGWHENCYGLLCDVRVRETIDNVIQQTIAHWGRIDIIANCTGYGVVAAAEDQSQHDLFNQFSTNFTGTLNILQLSLPYFRINGIPGRYLIFSSTSGALGVPGLAPYCATKYAVEGLIESMLYETDCFNIKATLVEPGYVRLEDSINDSSITTNVTSPTLVPLADPKRNSVARPAPAEPLKRYGHFVVKPNPSPPYASDTSPAGHAKRVFIWFDKRQPTSAVRSAELVWQLGHCSYPPLRLLLGSYAVESIRDRLRSVIEEIEDWKWLSFPSDDVEDSAGVGALATASKGVHGGGSASTKGRRPPLNFDQDGDEMGDEHGSEHEHELEDQDGNDDHDGDDDDIDIEDSDADADFDADDNDHDNAQRQGDE